MSDADEYQLHYAARNGDLEALEILLTSGLFNVNRGNFDLIRPLHEASLRGHYDCCLLLCNFGADVNLKTIDGATALCDACSNGSLECIKLLLQQGALVNVPFLLVTPLHEAILGNNWQCIMPLLEHGATIEASDLDYGTALQTAVIKGFVDCARILLQAGAEVNVSKNHQTPLHTSAKAGDIKMLSLLLEYGADVYLENGRGRTAAQLLPTACNECMDLLKAYESTPKSLRQVCRLRIRKSVGTRRLNSMSHLNLPDIMIRFLQFS